MVSLNRRRESILVLCVSILVLAAVPALAQTETEFKDVTALGGPNAFCRPPLKSVGDLQELFGERRAEIAAVLATSDWGGQEADLFAAVADGQVAERQIQIGDTFQWMILRKKGKAEIAPNLRWAGKKPIDVYGITFLSNDYQFTFVIPKACGNLSLIEKTPDPRPVAKVSATPASDCITRPIKIDTSASSITHGQVASVKGTLRHPDGKSEPLVGSGPSWTVSYKVPGVYNVSVTATSGTGRDSDPASAQFTLTPCPPIADIKLSEQEVYTGDEFQVDVSASRAVVGNLAKVVVEVFDAEGNKLSEMELTSPYVTTTHHDKPGKYTYRAVAWDDLGQNSEPVEATIWVVSRKAWFGDLLAGKERRSRDPVFGGSCEALVGAKVGMLYRARPHLEFGPSVGFAFNLEDSDHSSGFAEVELNYVNEGGFLGVGAGVWDFTHDDLIAPSLLMHGGIDLRRRASIRDSRLQFVVEGRLFLDEVDDVENNYMVWGGLRFRTH